MKNVNVFVRLGENTKNQNCDSLYTIAKVSINKQVIFETQDWIKEAADL